VFNPRGGGRVQASPGRVPDEPSLQDGKRWGRGRSRGFTPGWYEWSLWDRGTLGRGVDPGVSPAGW